MSELDRLSKLIEAEIQNLDLPSEPENLYAPICYTLESGGKRIRPVMVLLTASIYGAQLERAMPAAMAVEVFHNFTLLHDDIMDNADIRRGKPTVHKKWCENIAILSGDAMVIHSYELLSKAITDRFAQVFSTFNKLAALVCEGQQYDMDFESDNTTTIDEYIDMISLKTSALIAGALKIGALIGGATDQDCEKIYNIGMNLGNAFQLEDDLLDTYGDQTTFGKRIGGDILEKKKTFLLITALKNSDSAVREELIKILDSSTLQEDDKISKVKAIYDKLHVRPLTEQRIDSYFSEAMDIIDSLGLDNDKSELFKQFANKLVNRDK